MTPIPPDSLSTFESRTELPIGTRMPHPFERMLISAFLRRTDTGGWLYSLAFAEDLEASRD